MKEIKLNLKLGKIGFSAVLTGALFSVSVLINV